MTEELLRSMFLYHALQLRYTDDYKHDQQEELYYKLLTLL